MKISPLIRSFILMLPLMAAGAITCAQKLPSIQQNGIALPANIKIDGRAKEIDGHFAAYNKSVEVFFTLANDKDNLYLAVQATDPLIVKKIIYGGVSLTVCASGKRNDPAAASVTFPLISAQAQPGVSGAFSELNIALKAGKTPDSILTVLNNRASMTLKEIKVKGIKAISDTLISVYNDLGIKASALFDNKAALTYELLIPLKYLGVQPPKTIAYNIMLSGFLAVKQGVAKDGVVVVAVPKGVNTNPSLQYPTDCWGQYILAN